MANENFPPQDLVDLLTQEPYFENPKARQMIQEAIANAKQDYVKVDIPDTEEFERDSGTWTVAKNCPIEKHLCANQPEGCEGGACGFYNGYKERCVYPRTCINNTDSSVPLNMYDCLRGNISRYWGDQDGETAEAKIDQKRKELDLDIYGWAYAEFDDDGKKVRLVELGTSEQVEEWQREKRKNEKRLRPGQFEEQKKLAQRELETLISKYDSQTREDIKRIVELSKRLDRNF